MTTVARLLAEIGADNSDLSQVLRQSAEMVRQFANRTSLGFDQTAMRFRDAMGRFTATTTVGEQAGMAIVRGLRETLETRTSEAREALFRGLITRGEFERVGRQAAREFNHGLAAGMTQLGAEGLMTPGLRRQMTREFEDAGLQARRSATEVLGVVGPAMQRAGMAMTAAITVPVTAATVATGRLVSTFESNMNAVQNATQATAGEMAQLAAVARRMGAETKFSGADAAEGMRLLASSGLSVREVIGALPSVMQLAAAKSLDIATAADVATSMVGAFGLGVEKLGHVNDVLVGVTTRTKVSVQDLAYAMKYAAGPAMLVGSSFEETAAAMGLLAKRGIDASSAGTSLGAAFERLIRPIGESQKLVKSLGLDTVVAGGKVKSLAAVLDQLKRSGATSTQILTLFETQGARAIQALMAEGTPALQRLRTELERTSGTAKAAADVQTKGLGGAWEVLKSQAEELAQAVGDAGLTKALTTLARAAGDVVGFFSGLPKPVLLVGTAVAAMAATVGPLVFAFGSLAGAIVNLRTAAGLLSGVRGLGALAGVLGTGGPVLIGLAAFGAALFTVKRMLRETQVGADDYRRAIDALSESQLAQAKTALTSAKAGMQSEITRLQAAGAENIRAFREGRGEIGKFDASANAREIAKWQTALQAVDTQLGMVNARQTANAESAAKWRAEMEKAARDWQAALAQGAGQSGDAMKDLGTRVSLVSSALEHQRETGQQIRGLAEQYAGAWREVHAALRRSGNGVDELSDKLRGMVAQLEKATGLTAALKGLAGGPGVVKIAASNRPMLDGLRPDEALADAIRNLPRAVADAISSLSPGGAPGPTRVPVGPQALPMPRVDVSGVSAGITAQLRDFVVSLKTQVGRQFHEIGATIQGTLLSAFGPAALAGRALGVALEPLMPLLDALMSPLATLGQVVGQLVTPVLKLLYPILKGVAVVFSFVGEMVSRAVAGLVSAIGHAVRAIGKAIDALPLVSAKGVINAGQAIIDLAGEFYESADQMKRSREALQGTSWEDALKGLGSAARDAAEALRNMPTGYKSGLASAIFAATTAVGSPRATAAPSAAAMTKVSAPVATGPTTAVTVEGIYITQAPGEDGEELAERVVRALRRRALAQTGDITRWSEAL